MRVFQDQDAASAHLDSPGHRLRYFCSGENAARIQLVMACKPDSAQVVELLALAPGPVVQVRVVKSGTSILSRSDWPSSQVGRPGSSIPIPSRCSATASAVSGAPNNAHHRIMSGLSDLHGPGSPSNDLMASCGTGKSSRLSFFLLSRCMFICAICIHGEISRSITVSSVQCGII